MVDIKTLEDVISKVSGVVSVKVVEENGEPREIHVIASSDKNPKQIVRDIETMVLASLGFKLDRKIISVAQIDPQSSLPKKKYEIFDVSLKEYGNMVRVSVRVLSLNGEEKTGEYEGPNTSVNLPKVAGMAVVKSLDLNPAISVDDVQKLTMAGKEFVVCHLTFSEKSNETRILGTAPLENDFLKSVCYATLDALSKYMK